MSQKQSITQELEELNSVLANSTLPPVYQVPSGYFEQLADGIMLRIKAMDTSSAREELQILSPFLDGLSRKLPYSVPVGYFDDLEGISTEFDEGTAGELERLSPLLSGLKKQTPYSIPAGYFDRLDATVANEKAVTGAKVISIGARKWFRYAAAAIVIGFIAIGSVFVINRQDASSINGTGDPSAWVEKNLQKVSTDEIDNFVELIDEEQPVVAVLAASDEIKNLMKNVPDTELQEFLNDTQLAEAASDDDIILN